MNENLCANTPLPDEMPLPAAITTLAQQINLLRDAVLELCSRLGCVMKPESPAADKPKSDSVPAHSELTLEIYNRNSEVSELADMVTDVLERLEV